MDFSPEVRAAKNLALCIFLVGVLILPSAAMYVAFQYRNPQSKSHPALIAAAGLLPYGFFIFDIIERTPEGKLEETFPVITITLCVLTYMVSAMIVLIVGYEEKKPSPSIASTSEKSKKKEKTEKSITKDQTNKSEQIDKKRD